MKLLLIILLSLAFNVAFSQSINFPSFPNSTQLHSTNQDIQSILITCDPTKSVADISLTCTFSQTSLVKKLDKKEIDENVNRLVSFLEKPYTKYTTEFCAEAKIADPEQLDTYIKKTINEKTKAMCNVSSEKEAKSKLMDMYKSIFISESETCVIKTSHEWDEIFVFKNNDVQNGYWVSTPTPDSECGIMNISTLKPDNEYPKFWNYESQRIITNKAGTIQGVSCELFEDRKTVFSWMHKTFESECKRIEFSP